MRLTRSRLLASSRRPSSVRPDQSRSACMSMKLQKDDLGAAPALPAAGLATGIAAASVAGCAIAAASLTTWLTNGKSSIRRTISSSLNSSAGTSVSDALLMRSLSLRMARCTGLRRGWAARTSRCSADFRAASRGSALPVSWACCWASRKLASISTTRLSSRERDRLRINSSSWLRCKLTSLSRVSVASSRADSSRVASCAWRASVRASMAWAPASVLRLASSSCIWLIFCHDKSAPTAPAKASKSSPSAQGRVRQSASGTAAASTGKADASGLAGEAAAAGAAAGEVAGEESLMDATILSMPRCRPAQDVTR